MRSIRRLLAIVACAALALVPSRPLAAQDRPRASAGSALTATLVADGFVIVMRHASSPRTPPTPDTAKPKNTALERQLDAAGEAGSTAMGDALRALKIPIGEVLSSPTFRARETVRAARLPNVDVIDALGDNGQSMQGVTEAQAAWLRARVAQTPRSGNTLIVTHQPNLARAFPAWGGTVADGECVVLKPDGRNGVELMGRIGIEDWPRTKAPAPR
jgi:phosphohistidine phosphatase SixA